MSAHRMCRTISTLEVVRRGPGWGAGLGARAAAAGGGSAAAGLLDQALPLTPRSCHASAVADLMTTGALRSAMPDQPLSSAASKLDKVTGLAVVDEQNVVVGVISIRDINRLRKQVGARLVPPPAVQSSRRCSGCTLIAAGSRQRAHLLGSSCSRLHAAQSSALLDCGPAGHLAPALRRLI